MWDSRKSRAKLNEKFIKNNEFILEMLDHGLDDIKSGRDVPAELYDAFWRAKNSEEYQRAFTMAEPLVSVCTATYNRPEVLLERTIPSVLGQSYRNIEYIIVGDGCDEERYSRVAAIDDPRLRFVNLPERGVYPENPELRWMVAGTLPMNRALELSRGHFVTHIDDDDAFHITRIEKLVEFAQRRRLDFVWHPFYCGSGDGDWEVNEAERFNHSQVTNSGVFYHSWLNVLPFDPDAYRLREPGDWNRFRKLKHLGVAADRYPEPLLYHFDEGSQKRLTDE